MTAPDQLPGPPGLPPPRVSVVLLTYNHEAYIEQALASVLSQCTDFTVEVIITEDRSTDRTGEIIEAAAASHPDRIRLIRSAVNLNTNAVTTRALAIARGEYVAFVDGDDYWSSPDKLQRQVDLLDARPELAMCCHDVVVVGPDGEVIEPSFRRLLPGPEVASYADIVQRNYVAGPSPMIRSSALAGLAATYLDAEFGDWPLYICAAEVGGIGYLPEVLAAYRSHPLGYWSRLGPAEQTRRLVSFLRLTWLSASRPRRRDLARALAAHWLGGEDAWPEWRAGMEEALSELWLGATGKLRRELDSALADLWFASPREWREALEEPMRVLRVKATRARRLRLDLAVVLALARAIAQPTRLQFHTTAGALVGSPQFERQRRSRRALLETAWRVLRGVKSSQDTAQEGDQMAAAKGLSTTSVTDQMSTACARATDPS